jgi:L-asparaginase/beta-aspartyl-peptidase (threonine type)
MVMDTPHLLLCGEGATTFARSRGVPDFHPVSERARERYRRVREFFAGRDDWEAFQDWSGRDPAEFWNFPATVEATLRSLAGPSDTVGAVVRDAEGRCATAVSTGGTSIMLLGRIGDSPIIGAGLYAGPEGAVTTTGDGEEIMRRLLALRVYDWIAEGVPAQEAVERGVGMVDGKYTAGIIAVSRTDAGAADNRTMPFAIRKL